MNPDVESLIRRSIGAYKPPGALSNLEELGVIRGFEWADEHHLIVRLLFGFPMRHIHQALSKACLELNDLPESITVTIDAQTRIRSHQAQTASGSIAGVKNFIAIGSGKGGVGKSTVSAGLALALSAQGARVGLVDADIYGPNIPELFSTGHQSLAPSAEGKFLPIQVHGLQIVSVAYLLKPGQALPMRGPMISNILQQLVRDTQWEDLDYVLIDLPPGTGDIHLTLGQKVPLSGAIVVTTPHEMSFVDAAKSIDVFQRLQIPILGLVENMTQHICTACGHQNFPFGQGAGSKLASKYQLPLLGHLPIEPNGIESNRMERYAPIALGLASELSRRPIDYSARFGKIVVESSSE